MPYTSSSYSTITLSGNTVNNDSSTSAWWDYNGSNAGGVIVFIVALVVLAVAVVFFIIWFVFNHIIASTVIISCFVYTGGDAISSAKMHPPIPVAYSKRFKQNIGLEDNSSKWKKNSTLCDLK